MFYVPTGLFNISDKVLVSLDIFLEWRFDFKRGVLPTVAVESKLATLMKKTDKVCKGSFAVLLVVCPSPPHP